MIRKKTIIILAVIIIIIIGLAVALMLTDENFFNPQSKDTQADITGSISQPAINANQPDQELPAAPEPVLTQNEQFLTTVARNFAERFASYSTDSHAANLVEVKLLASAKLSAKLDGLINSSGSQGEYYGVSSKVLKVKINNLNEAAGEAEVTVSLQREETDAQNKQLVYYQDLYLNLISSGSDWLVDSFAWQTLD